MVEILFVTTATIRYSGVVDAITTPVIHCIRCQSQRLPIQEIVGRGTRLARALDIYTPWLWILAIRISCTQVVMKAVQQYTERLIVEVTGQNYRLLVCLVMSMPW